MSRDEVEVKIQELRELGHGGQKFLTGKGPLYNTGPELVRLPFIEPVLCTSTLACMKTLMNVTNLQTHAMTSILLARRLSKGQGQERNPELTHSNAFALGTLSCILEYLAQESITRLLDFSPPLQIAIPLFPWDPSPSLGLDIVFHFVFSFVCVCVCVHVTAPYVDQRTNQRKFCLLSCRFLQEPKIKS